ncbi:hypothetical protein, partial [Loktanella salsilacus]|uniref:hypothetical protein n=1 Tax=Loktanella salsilacus TaxID=195913 RepID=UPI0035632F53
QGTCSVLQHIWQHSHQAGCLPNQTEEENIHWHFVFPSSTIWSGMGQVEPGDALLHLQWNYNYKKQRAA